jgi:hypothetical protein
LIANIRNVLEILDKNVASSSGSLTKVKTNYQQSQHQYQESIVKEKEHF